MKKCNCVIIVLVIIMKKFRYFIYDVLNISNKKEIEIFEFEYDNTTLAIDFFHDLYKKYIIENNERLRDYSYLINNISFHILDIFNYVVIDDFSKDLFFWEIIEQHKEDKVFCVEPVFPVGDTVAKYHNYKIIIHSNENNHLRYPHVHVYDQIGQNTIVSLLNFKMEDDTFLKRKDKKKILDYIKENKNKLIEHYNQIIDHKEIQKVVIDIIA